MVKRAKRRVEAKKSQFSMRGMNRNRWAKMMKAIEAHEKHLDEHPEDIGPVWQFVRAKRCRDSDAWHGECCGVHGHKGPHWRYREDGTFEQWRRKDDKGRKLKPWDWASRHTPPGHASYVHPQEMAEHYYMRHGKSVQVQPKARKSRRLLKAARERAK